MKRTSGSSFRAGNAAGPGYRRHAAAGVKLDVDFLAQMGRDMGRRLGELQEQISSSRPSALTSTPRNSSA